MPAIATSVAEVDFTMVDDRVRPVGDVERAIGPLFDIDGAKGGRGCAKQIIFLLGYESRSPAR